MRSVTEAFHAFVYFSPAVLAEYERVGITHPRMAYFGPRSAPLGEVPASVVAATFYNFNPVKVAEHIPRVWSLIPPEDLVSIRLRAVSEHLPAALGLSADASRVGEAVELARWAAESCRFEGRPLAAAHAEVQPPDDPLTALWHYVSVLREHRGDGHIFALQVHDVDAKECLIFRRPDAETSERYRRSRGWQEDEWADARERLVERGYIHGSHITEQGHEVLESVESMTDQLALGPWAALGDEELDRFASLMRPMNEAAQQVVETTPLGSAMMRR